MLVLKSIVRGYILTNMAEDKIKVYTPEILEDQPFPQQEETDLGVSQETSGGVYSPTTIKNKPFPKKRIAHETISSALNTISRKILGVFEFLEMGAIQIGKYVNGVSGDLRISPGGITARDKAGITTFSIDGETGDAVFKGTVQAGSILTGGVTVEDENGTTIIDGTGLVSTANFNYGSLTITNQPVFTPGDNNWHDLTGLSQSFDVGRDVRILFLMSVAGLPDAGSVNVRMNITGISLTDIPTIGITTDAYVQTNHRVYVVSAGTIIYKLQYRCNGAATQFQLDPSVSTFLALGT